MSEEPLNMPQGMNARPIIFGEVLFDRFPDGAVLGGAPFNVAWHLQGFGCPPFFLSRVGEDEPGQRVRQAMQDWGMDTAGVQIDPEYPTGAVEVRLAQGEHSFDILPEQAYDHIDMVLASEAIKRFEPALVYHGTLVLRTDHVRRAVDDVLANLSVPVFVDVNLRDPWWREADLPPLLARARWVKVNEDELSIIATRLGHTASDLQKTAQRVREAYDIALLIVTRGAHGAVAFGEESNEVAAVAPDEGAKVMDTVGAGDAFTSVVLLGILRGWSLRQMMERAQGFASRICTQRGATSRDLAMYRALRREWGEAL